jgi:hypothetical protein
LVQEQIASLQANDFADSGAGVEHEAQKDMIAMAIATGAINARENRLDLGQFEVLNFAQGASLKRDSQNPLRQGQVFRMIGADITKEAMDGTQPHVSRADLVMPHSLQMLQKSKNPIARQLLERQLTGISFLTCHKLQE